MLNVVVMMDISNNTTILLILNQMLTVSVIGAAETPVQVCFAPNSGLKLETVNSQIAIQCY